MPGRLFHMIRHPSERGLVKDMILVAISGVLILVEKVTMEEAEEKKHFGYPNNHNLPLHAGRAYHSLPPVALAFYGKSSVLDSSELGGAKGTDG